MEMRGDAGPRPTAVRGFIVGLLDALARRRRSGMRVEAAYPGWASAPCQAIDGPLISVLMPVFDPPAAALSAAIGSVRHQTYRHWQLCIADDASSGPEVASIIARQAAADPRICTVRLDRNRGIAPATNAALGLSAGEIVALLDHDDELAPHALARLAAEAAAHPAAEMFFSDEDQLAQGRHQAPYFKPGWNPDLMLGQNVVNHLAGYRRERLLALGGWREGFEGSQDYELALRFAGSCGAAAIRHIPGILYHWRQLPGSFSAADPARAGAAARRALAEHLPGTKIEAELLYPGWSRVSFPVPDPEPLVSIVGDTGRPPPADPHYTTTETVASADTARGAVLLMLAPGLQPFGPGWLRELVSHALRPEIGAAGGRLDRPDGRILQSGLVLDPDRIAQTVSPRSDPDDPGYFGQFRLPRTVSALSLDCLAIRRDLFMACGGFDAACGPYADVDLCLRLASRGLRCVWTPHARLRYQRLPARTSRRVARDAVAAHLMRERWGAVLARDPYFNPNLAIRNGNLALARRQAAPTRTFS